MFVVSKKPTFTHTVKIMVPTDGGYKASDLKTTFRVMPTDEANQYELDTAAGSSEFLRQVIECLHDLVDEDKSPLSYSDEVRDELLRQPYVRAGLARHYFNAISRAAEGN